MFEIYNDYIYNLMAEKKANLRKASVSQSETKDLHFIIPAMRTAMM